MIRKIVHYTDSLLTQEQARTDLEDKLINVAWYTNKTNKQSVVHSHPYYELILPVSGTVMYSYNGEISYVKPGELIIFPDEIYHSGKYDTDNVVSERLLLQVDGNFWHETAKKLGVFYNDWNREVTILQAESVINWDIRGLFERMSLASIMKEKYLAPIYEAQLSELLMIICQIVEEKHVDRPASSSNLVEKAVKYIQDNYDNPDLDIDEICKATFCSRSHLSRTFKEYTMESLFSYITNLRMQYFIHYLSEGMPVIDACSKCGFSNYSSFLKTFRKKYGLTPQEYKKRSPAE